MDSDSSERQTKMDNMDLMLFSGLLKRLLAQKLEPFHEKYGLHGIDFLMLYLLARMGNKNTARDLLEVSAHTKGHISQSLRHLSKMGLIVMERDNNDRRVIHNILTDRALEITGELVQSSEETAAGILEGLSDEDIGSLLRCTKKINSNILSALDRSREHACGSMKKGCCGRNREIKKRNAAS